MNASEIGAYVPELRPHNRLRDHQVFFMLSSRPFLTMSDEELALYRSIDGRKTISELEQIHPGSSDTLLRWHEAEALDLLRPVLSPRAPHLMVIEPHMDDAILSAGGRLLRRRGQCRITILSVVKRSIFTSYLLTKRDSPNVEEATALREQESSVVARLLGAEHRSLNWNDAPLRFMKDWSPEILDRFKSVPHAFVNLFPNPDDIQLLANQLGQELTALRPDELWIPMGLGDHVDHRITRSACLAMLAGESAQFSHVSVSMYEDIPYARRIGHAKQISAVMASEGTRLVPSTEDITDMFGEKLRIACAYASQFKRSYIEPTLRDAARRASGAPDKLAESFHRVEAEIRLPAESRLSREWSGIAALRRSIRALLPNRNKISRLTVMAIPSGHLGWWPADRDSLASAFPNAEILVYASEDLAWQAKAGGTDKLRLEFVKPGWKGWSRVFWRELFHLRTPTIVIWQGANGGTPLRLAKKLINTFLRCALPFRRISFAKSLSDFCGVLNEELGVKHEVNLEIVSARTACEPES